MLSIEKKFVKFNEEVCRFCRLYIEHLACPCYTFATHMTNLQTFEGPIMIRGRGIGFFHIPDVEEDVLIPAELVSFALDGDIGACGVLLGD